MAQASACAWPRARPDARAASFRACRTSPCTPLSISAKGAPSGGGGVGAFGPAADRVQTVTGQSGNHAETTRFIVLLQHPGARRPVAAADELGGKPRRAGRARIEGVDR